MKKKIKDKKMHCRKGTKTRSLLCLCGFAAVILILPTGSHAQTRDLNYYVNAALQNSPLLKEHKSHIEINSLDSLIRRAEYGPQVRTTSTGVYAPDVKGWGYDRASVDRTTFSALMTISQTITGGRNMKAQMASYDIERQSISNSRKISEQDLRLSITTQYLTTYEKWEEILYNDQLLDLLKKEEVLIKKMTEGLLYKQTEYLSFHVNMQQQQLLLSQLRSEYSANIALLNYLCGIVDTTFVELSNPVITLGTISAFESTPQFRKFQIDSLFIRNSHSLIDYQYRPRLEVYADAGYVSTFASQAQKNFGASAGLSLVVPIFDGRQRNKQHNKLRYTEQVRANYETFARRQYEQQLASLRQQLAQSESIISQADEIIRYAQTLMEAYSKQLPTGEVSITDYIMAINNFLSAKYAVTQNTNARLQIINQINYWNDEY